MPSYDYKCTSCGKVHEMMHKMNEEPKVECPDCGTPTLRRVYQPVSLQFQGNGFYKTDYAASEKPISGHCGKQQCGCKHT